MPELGALEDRVRHEVELWVRWLPRWKPGTHRARVRLCRRCFGSPVLAAAGLDQDAPHGVQHAFSMRMKHIIDSSVEEYTAKNLPSLHQEIRAAEARRALQPYRAGDGLDPEHLGLDLDPDPDPEQPFLFTLSELETVEAERTPAPPQRQFSEDEKAALRAEVKLADEFAKLLGHRMCIELGWHKKAIRAALDELIEPQIAELMAELERQLDSPLWG